LLHIAKSSIESAPRHVQLASRADPTWALLLF
jgi:hypothetical protein